MLKFLKIPGLVIFITLLASTLSAQDHHFDATVVINNQTFTIQIKDIDTIQTLLKIIRNSKKIVLDTLDGGLVDYKLIDFNQDGDSDLMLMYGGNNVTEQLYLFDPLKNTFRNVENFENYPEAIQLKSNINYYYSYHRAGCADMNWVSDLFKIENFKAVQLGHIDGQGCDFEVDKNPQEIYIYKILNNNNENKKLLQKLPYLVYIPEFTDKWEFLKKYWNGSYKKFL